MAQLMRLKAETCESVMGSPAHPESSETDGSIDAQLQVNVCQDQGTFLHDTRSADGCVLDHDQSRPLLILTHLCAGNFYAQVHGPV